jgi:hypothetical protein
MDWLELARRIDADTARSFVTAARHVIDALLIEAQRVQQTQTPAPRDYATATLPRTAPPGGWLSDAELRRTTQALSEAIAAEKWLDGLLTALRLLALLGT